MSLNVESKLEILKKFGRHERDTASPEVQVALITQKLNVLTEHAKKNAKDQASKKGLIKLVGRRRRLLDYLDATNHEAYKNIIQKLGIRK